MSVFSSGWLPVMFGTPQVHSSYVSFPRKLITLQVVSPIYCNRYKAILICKVRFDKYIVLMSSSATNTHGVHASVVDGTPSPVGHDFARRSHVRRRRSRRRRQKRWTVEVLGRRQAGSSLSMALWFICYPNTLLRQRTKATTMPNMTLYMLSYLPI